MAKRSRKNKIASVKEMAAVDFEPVDLSTIKPDFGKVHFDTLHIGLAILGQPKEKLADMWAQMKDEDLIGAIKTFKALRSG